MRLCKLRFPGETAAIDRWFQACHDARKAGSTLMAMHSLPSWIGAGFACCADGKPRSGPAVRWPTS